MERVARAGVLALILPTVRGRVATRQDRLLAVAAMDGEPVDELSGGVVAVALHRDRASLLAGFNQVLTGYTSRTEDLRMIEGFGFTAGDLPASVGTTNVLAA